MPRTRLFLLASMTLASLSCGVVSMAPPGPQSPEAAAVLADASPNASEHAVDAAYERETAEIARFLATRRTGLARDEIDVLARTIRSEAQRRDLDPALVMAVMHVESRFNTYAVSPVGAMGLMQILPSTGEELAQQEGVSWHGAQTLFDPIVNVRLGVAYLEQLSDRYGKISTALAAYNWGPGHIDRRLRRGRALPTEYPSLVLEAHAAQRNRRS